MEPASVDLAYWLDKIKPISSARRNLRMQTIYLQVICCILLGGKGNLPHNQAQCIRTLFLKIGAKSRYIVAFIKEEEVGIRLYRDELSLPAFLKENPFL
jgi:hypothetical protein